MQSTNAAHPQAQRSHSCPLPVCRKGVGCSILALRCTFCERRAPLEPAAAVNLTCPLSPQAAFKSHLHGCGVPDNNALHAVHLSGRCSEDLHPLALRTFYIAP